MASGLIAELGQDAVQANDGRGVQQGAAPMKPDLLAQAIDHTRHQLADKTRPTKERVRTLWAAAKNARRNGRWTGADVRKSGAGWPRRYFTHHRLGAARLNPFKRGRCNENRCRGNG